MTKKTRNIIFLILLLLFLIASPAAVMYGLGWRFDWKTKKLIQPGIFYFKTWPKGCQIYINNVLKKKTDIFFGAASVENLMPGNYDLEIKKEGYHSWKKNLLILKRQVTKAENIVLIPKNPAIALLSKNTESFFFSPDEKKIVIKEKDSPETDWSLKLIETKNDIKSHLISQQDLRLGVLSPKGKGEPEEIELIDLEFSQDSKKILLSLGAKEKIHYFVLDIKTKEITPLETTRAEKVFFDPENSNSLIALSDWEIKRIAPEQILLQDVVAAAIEDKNIYYIDKQGFIYKTGLDNEHQERINIIPFEIKEEIKYELYATDNNILLKESQTLYFFDKEKMAFEKLLDPAKDFALCQDNKKIAYFNNNEIWVVFLQEKYEQPQKNKGEKTFINRFSENIGDLFWYTENYLIFNLQDKIKITEIDDRDNINIVDLAEFKEPEIFFANKKLYVLSENSFYASEELIP